jgi:hypothetical protein
LVEKAVWSKNMKLRFKPVTNGNHGASSVFDANPAYPYETYEQDDIEVDAVRLDRWWRENMGEKTIDLLVMDLQGAELEALKGAGRLLRDVKFIITEGQFKHLYHKTPLLVDLEMFLAGHGFKKIHQNKANDWFGDAMFQRVRQQ